MSGKIIEYRYLDSRGKMRFHAIRTSGLFTGEKDIKNKDIYQDDIIRHPHSREARKYFKDIPKWAIGVVCFRDGGFFIDYSGSGTVFRYLASIDKIEVIGNVDENPELLSK